MFASLALAVAFGGAGISAPTQSDRSVGDLLRAACVDTGLGREALEETARRERWRSVAIRSNSSGSGWDAAYRAGGYSIVLSRVDTAEDAADASVGTTCMVTTDRPGADWRGEVERFAAEQQLAAEPAVDIPGFGSIPTWSRPLDRTLTAAYQERPRSLTLTLSRQIVVSRR